MPGAARGHRLGQPARHHHRRPQVDRDRAVDVLGGEARDVAAAREAGVRDQHIHVAGPVEQALHVGRVREVAGDRAAAGLGCERRQHVSAAPGDDERGAPRRHQRAGDRGAEAARGARDQGGASAQLHEAGEPTGTRRRSP